MRPIKPGKLIRLPKLPALISACIIALISTKAGAQTQAGWDVNGQSGYGTSPLSASSTGPNVTVGGLTRGSGVATTGTAASNAWGGANWTSANEAAAIAANKYATFTIKANAGYKASVDSIKFAYRRSSTGATTGELQYSLDGTTFTDLAALSYPSTSTSGATHATIALQSIAALHNVNSCTTITFRIVNWGASGSAGTWYINNTLTGNDLIVYGTNATVAPTKLAVTTITPSTPTAGAGFDVVVESQDATSTASNVVTNTGFSLSTNGAAGAIGGTTTGNILAGTNVYTVTGVTLATTGTGATITATRTSGDCLTAGVSTAFNVTSTPCTGAPGGTASADVSSFCGSGSSNLSVAGYSAGSGITFQWLESATSDSGPWTVISGATNNTYTTPTLTTTTYYAAITTCSGSGISDTTLPGVTITINSFPTVSPISGTTSIPVGTSSALSSSPSGGTWSSSNAAVATVDASGNVTGVAYGTATISYAYTNMAGCTTTVTTVVSVGMNPFTTGNLVVWRAEGTGSDGTAITLVEYDRITADQPTPITENPLPTTGAARVVSSGSATSEGHLNLDKEWTHIVLAGYDAAPGTTSVATAGSINRVVYSVPQSGLPAEVSNVPQTSAFNSNNVRSATANGTDYYAAGNASTSVRGGVQLMGATTSAQVASTTINTRVVSIFNGQLYYSTASSTGSLGIYAVGTGIPTSLTASSNVINTGSSTSPYGFSFSPDGNTCYIADDASSTTKGVQKWVLSGGVWSMAYRLAANAGARCVAVDYSTNPYTVYATTASGSSTTVDTLIKIVDAGSGSGYTRLATSPAGTSFRGVTFAPACDVKMYTRSETTYCGSGSASVIFYGNPGATVVYSVNGVNDTITLGDNGTDTIGTGSMVVVGGVSTAYTYTLVSISTSVCDFTAVEGTVEFTINPATETPEVASTEICMGDVTVIAGTPTGGTWTSGNTDIFTIDSETGEITGVGAGTAVVTYTLGSGGCTSIATANITVYELPTVDAITGATEVCVGSTIVLSDATAGGSWYSSDDAIATVDTSTGVVTGVSEGTVTITYLVSNEIGCSAYATYTVTVNSTPSLDAITGVDEICVNGNIVLADETPGGTWSSSDPSVASVNSSGVVIGVSVGTAEITYTVTNEFGCTAYVTVTVNVVICGGKAAPGMLVATEASASAIRLYPNPVGSTLFIEASQKVNIAVMSVDGKVLIEQKDASGVNVSNLANGVYFIKVYSEANVLLQTSMFSKN